MNNIIEIKNLSKAYKNGGEALDVLRGITLQIKRNEFLAIQGPSGAGKSTLLHILGALDYPTEGNVSYDGKDLYGLSEDERATFRNQKIGFIFQFYHLLPGFNALENVLLPSLLNSWWSKKKSLGFALELLNNLGLTNRIKHRPNQLSGGEQQRIAIARALINKPQVLFCDEPTGNLDSENGKNILQLLKKLNQEQAVTIVLVTHDKELALNAQRVVYLRDGKLLN